MLQYSMICNRCYLVISMIAKSILKYHSFKKLEHWYHILFLTYRWDEALKDCSTALGPLMKKMIINMPEVAVVSLVQLALSSPKELETRVSPTIAEII